MLVYLDLINFHSIHLPHYPALDQCPNPSKPMVLYCHSAWDIKHFMVCMQGQSWWLGASHSSLPHPSWNCALLLLRQWRTVLHSRAENVKTSAYFKEVPYEEHLALLKEWFCKNCLGQGRTRVQGTGFCLDLIWFCFWIDTGGVWIAHEAVSIKSELLATWRSFFRL